MRLQQSLTAMISLMMLASCPITFVITKWDLLRDIAVDDNAADDSAVDDNAVDDNERLRRVRKFLMGNQGFRDLVEAHSTHRVVRLIPVSAVGPDFAEVTENGMVAKLSDGQLRPTNVDVPLSAVVPDVFEQVERSMDRARLQAALDRVSQQARRGPVGALTELGEYVATSASKLLGPFAPHAAFLGDAAAELFGARDAAVIDRHQRLERQLRETDRAIEEYQLARRKVLRDFQSRVDVLEGRLPSSRLSRED
jgi:hypothetical protein